MMSSSSTTSPPFPPPQAIPSSSTTTKNNFLPSIPLEGLPLRPSTLKQFHQRGFYTTKEIDESRRNMTNFAAELNLPMNDTILLLKEVDKCLEIEVQPLPTASQILSLSDQRSGGGSNHHHHSHSSVSRPKNIVTFSRHIDQLLSGGITLGHVTEIAGMPGTGKTQLAMQLCVNAALPTKFGGVEGRAIYIDSEGSFTPERTYEMAQALVTHVTSSAQRHHTPGPSQNWTPESILDGIQVYRVHDETSQTSTLYNLPQYMEQQHLQDRNGLPIKLIVLDSIAFHYRAITPTDHNYYVQRTQALTHLAAFLGDLAQSYQIAIVVINQMTTKVIHKNNNNYSGSSSSLSSRLVPALGESWAHATTTRILLTDGGGGGKSSSDSSSNNSQASVKTFTLVKSPNLPQGKAQYEILSCGIRDPQKPKQPRTTESSPALSSSSSSRGPTPPSRITYGDSQHHHQQKQTPSYDENENNQNKRVRMY